MSSCWELDPLLTDTFLVQGDNEDRDMSHEDMFDWDSYSNDQPYMNDGSIDDQGALTSRKETPDNGQQTYQESIVPGTDDAWMLKETCSDANTDHPVPSRFAESMPLAPPSMDYCQQSLVFYPYQNTPYGFDSMYSYSPGPTDFSYFAEPPYTNSISSSARTSATLSSTDRQHGDISSTAKPVERSRSPISDVTRSKGRGNRLGQTHSSATRAKIAAYGHGRTRSAATGAKISAAQSLLFHVKRLHEQNFKFAGKSVSSVEVPTFQAVHNLTGYGRKAIRSAIKDRNGVVGGKWVITCLGRVSAKDGAIQNLLGGYDIAQAESSQPRSDHNRSSRIYGCIPIPSSQIQGSGCYDKDWYQVSDMSYLHATTHTVSFENSFGTPHLQDFTLGFEGSITTDTVANRDEPVVPPKSRKPLHCSEATRAKMRVAAANRAPMSEATRAKMREAALSRPPRAPTSEATRAKLRVAASKRAPASEASRSKMRKAALNRAPVPKATRAKLRAAALNRAAASKAS
jgi:hypothetical protein